MSDQPCVVCRHRVPVRGVVCEPDRKRISDQLAALPKQLVALEAQLVPGSAPPGPRVATSRTGSPVGARLDALNLVGPGSDGLSREAVAGMLHPHVRKWRTVETVTVTTLGSDGPHEEVREVVVWHQELDRDAAGKPVLVADDDQVGLLPPIEWLDSWARAWRRHFGHRRTPPTPAGRSRPRTVEEARRAAAELVAAQRRYAIQVVLGLTPGHGGAPVLRAADPVEEEMAIRYGPRDVGAPAADVMYLLEWLDPACEQDVGIADFAAELRTLTAELSRVLGDQPDQQWLGRCPAKLTDRDTGVSRTCGAGLWQDPYASQIVCPRCRSTWGSGGLSMLRLAQEMRQAWPVDRRRQYTAEQIKGLDLSGLRCPGCGDQAQVVWRDATTPSDRIRHFRPAEVVCPAGCADAGRLL